jgi:hypothetical protein
LENCFFLISYSTFRGPFWSSPNHVSTAEGVNRKFFLLKILCLNWGRNFDPPRTQLWGAEGLNYS